MKKNETKFRSFSGNIEPGKDIVFVFGSNPEGRHGAGAAKVAVDKFHARYGVGEGLTGEAYALPTKDLRVKENNGLRSISKPDIIAGIRRLYAVARENPEKSFEIAYRNVEKPSLNGYTGIEMMKMFNSAGARDLWESKNNGTAPKGIPANIVFSKEWVDANDMSLETYMRTSLYEPNLDKGIERTAAVGKDGASAGRWHQQPQDTDRALLFYGGMMADAAMYHFGLQADADTYYVNAVNGDRDRNLKPKESLLLTLWSYIKDFRIPVFKTREEYAKEDINVRKGQRGFPLITGDDEVVELFNAAQTDKGVPDGLANEAVRLNREKTLNPEAIENILDSHLWRVPIVNEKRNEYTQYLKCDAWYDRTRDMVFAFEREADGSEETTRKQDVLEALGDSLLTSDRIEAQKESRWGSYIPKNEYYFFSFIMSEIRHGMEPQKRWMYGGDLTELRNNPRFVRDVLDKGSIITTAVERRERGLDDRLSDGLARYQAAKDGHSNALVLFAVGESYETYLGDAKRLSREFGMEARKTPEGYDFVSFPEKDFQKVTEKINTEGQAVVRLNGDIEPGERQYGNENIIVYDAKNEASNSEKMSGKEDRGKGLSL